MESMHSGGGCGCDDCQCSKLSYARKYFKTNAGRSRQIHYSRSPGPSRKYPDDCCGCESVPKRVTRTNFRGNVLVHHADTLAGVSAYARARLLKAGPRAAPRAPAKVFQKYGRSFHSDKEVDEWLAAPAIPNEYLRVPGTVAGGPPVFSTREQLERRAAIRRFEAALEKDDAIAEFNRDVLPFDAGDTPSDPSPSSLIGRARVGVTAVMGAAAAGTVHWMNRLKTEL